MGNLQHDGSGINVGTYAQIGTQVNNNWVHDCNRQGIRFDYHDKGGKLVLREDGKIHGDGIYMYNVSWKTQPNQVKGDRHLILNNTVVSCNRYPNPEKEEMNMSIQGFKVMHGIEGNVESVTRNNLANLTHRSWNLKNWGYKDGWKKTKDGYKQPTAQTLPGINDHNIKEQAAAYKLLRDPENYDFRPKKDSKLIDAGATVAKTEIKSPVAKFTGLKYQGKAPDIGAYEYGDKRYWIPGRKEIKASTPIPPNNSKTVKPDADLMFLEAYKADKHILYFGTAPDSLTKKAELTDSNIFSPGKLNPSQTYYWRIDSLKNGKTTRGDTWNFTVERE